MKNLNVLFILLACLASDLVGILSAQLTASVSPTESPTPQPSFWPTSRPTSQPSTIASIRNITCGECQFIKFGVCVFQAENIHIFCPVNNLPCQFNGRDSGSYTSIHILPPSANANTNNYYNLTHVQLIGTCDLTVDITGDFMFENTRLSLQGDLTVTSDSKVSLQGQNSRIQSNKANFVFNINSNNIFVGGSTLDQSADNTGSLIIFNGKESVTFNSSGKVSLTSQNFTGCYGGSSNNNEPTSVMYSCLADGTLQYALSNTARASIHNNSIIVTSPNINIGSGAQIDASLILMCASQSINVYQNAILSSEGLGCNTLTSINSPKVNPSSSTFELVSGRGHSGGGVIALMASDIYIDSNVEINVAGKEVGAGGSALISSTSLIMKGVINGCKYGNIFIYYQKNNAIINLPTPTQYGDYPSSSSSLLNVYDTPEFPSSSAGYAKYYIFSPGLTKSCNNYPTVNNPTVNWPGCPQGFAGRNGQNRPFSDGSVCQFCAVNKYKTSNESSDCITCPSSAYPYDSNQEYYDEATSIGDFCSVTYSSYSNPYLDACCWLCPVGTSYYAKDHGCYTAVQQSILKNFGTFTNFALAVIGILLILMSPVFIYKLNRRYGCFDKKIEFQAKKGFANAILDQNGDLVLDVDARTGSETINNPMGSVNITMGTFKSTLNNNVDTSTSRSSDIKEAERKKNLSDKAAVNRAFAKTYTEMQNAFRLFDIDLETHACRVNLLGSNSPFEGLGGAWVLPKCRPICLRPMLKRKEYREFAETLNSLFIWDLKSIEMVLFYLLRLLCPPLSEVYMQYLRYRRAFLLLQEISKCKYKFIKSKTQRRNKNSVRVNISPDCTLAYIDFLFDSSAINEKYTPLCPIGQIRLPVSFRIAGHGTFFSPYSLDTNDIVLQSVSSTDLATFFIDSAWIEFVAELNTILRTVYSSNIKNGLRRLLLFLDDKIITTQLGGLVVELCTYQNIEEEYSSDLLDKEDKKAKPVLTSSNNSVSATPSYRPSVYDDNSKDNAADDLDSLDGKAQSSPIPIAEHDETSGNSSSSSSTSIADARMNEVETKNATRKGKALEVKIDMSKLSFNDVCDIISGRGRLSRGGSGNILLGIKVSHPSVDKRQERFGDDDYRSDDEEEEENDENDGDVEIECPSAEVLRYSDFDEDIAVTKDRDSDNGSWTKSLNPPSFDCMRNSEGIISSNEGGNSPFYEDFASKFEKELRTEPSKVDIDQATDLEKSCKSTNHDDSHGKDGKDGKDGKLNKTLLASSCFQTQILCWNYQQFKSSDDDSVSDVKAKSRGEGVGDVSQNPTDRRIPKMGFYLTDYLRIFFLESLFPSFSCNVFLGVNVYPFGGTIMRSICELLLTLMCVADFLLFGFIYVQFAALYNNANGNFNPSIECKLWVFIFPFAVVISPILGVASILLQDSQISRVYNSWLRLSFINTFVLLITGFASLTQYGLLDHEGYQSSWNSNNLALLAFGQLFCKLLQLFLCDLYVAHIEAARWTRGWDGLSTSLYASPDRRLRLNAK